MGSVDESPDPKGKPIMISVVRNLKNGENIVTGVKRMAAKCAKDYYRNEETILKVLHTACDSSSFDFKKDFVDRLKMRGGDGASTESLYHKMLGDTKNEVEENNVDERVITAFTNEAMDIFPRLICQLHGNNSVLRHVEKCVASTSTVFELIRVLAKHIGNRSIKNDRKKFFDYMKSKNKRTCNIRGLTGVRFNENISDSANILVILDGVQSFVESVEVSDGFAADFQSLCSNSNFKHV